MANLAGLQYEVESWDYNTFHVPAKREELEILFKGWGEKTQALVEVRSSLLLPSTSRTSLHLLTNHLSINPAHGHPLPQQMGHL